MHTYIYAYIHICIQTHMHTYIYAYIPAISDPMSRTVKILGRLRGSMAFPP